MWSVWRIRRRRGVDELVSLVGGVSVRCRGGGGGGAWMIIYGRTGECMDGWMDGWIKAI